MNISLVSIRKDNFSELLIYQFMWGKNAVDRVKWVSAPFLPPAHWGDFFLSVLGGGPVVRGPDAPHHFTQDRERN